MARVINYTGCSCHRLACCSEAAFAMFSLGQATDPGEMFLRREDHRSTQGGLHCLLFFFKSTVNSLAGPQEPLLATVKETETCKVRVCHVPRQPPQNHPSRQLGGWATPWSAEETLDGQHQRADISAHARAAHKGLLQKRLGEDLCLIASPVLRLPPHAAHLRHKSPALNMSS